MSRPKKFRVWDKKNKKFINPHRPVVDMERAMIFADILNGNDKRYEIMQFIDFLDKNSKKIYEGDIVKCGEHIGHIEWNEGCYLLRTMVPPPKNKTDPQQSYALFCMNEKLKVLGNIYENPELLKEPR